jgi:hypothetical protein
MGLRGILRFRFLSEDPSFFRHSRFPAVIPEIFHRESRDFKNDNSVNLSPLEKEQPKTFPLKKEINPKLPPLKKGD